MTIRKMTRMMRRTNGSKKPGFSGLYYLNARYYDPETGRFISQDTYRGELDDPNQWHLYAYCANDPINYTDPSGHWSQTYTRYQAKNTYRLLVMIKITSWCLTLLTINQTIKKIARVIMKSNIDAFKRIVLKEAKEDLKGFIIGRIFSKLKEGFRKGGYDYLRTDKWQKGRKSGKVRVSVTEPIIRTKMIIDSKGFRFYHRSYSRSFVRM